MTPFAPPGSATRAAAGGGEAALTQKASPARISTASTSSTLYDQLRLFIVHSAPSLAVGEYYVGEYYVLGCCSCSRARRSQATAFVRGQCQTDRRRSHATTFSINPPPYR